MKYAIRLTWYLIKLVSAALLVVGLLTMAFYTSLYLANVGVLLTDGLEKRAEVILLKAEESEMNKFFTRYFIEKDDMLRTDKYAPYVIRSFDHKVKIEWMWNWAWQSTATATIVERIDWIDGEIPKAQLTPEQAATNKKFTPPKWEPTRYRVHLKKVDGQWKIDDVIFLELAPDEVPIGTVNPSATPVPSPSPAP